MTNIKIRHLLLDQNKSPLRPTTGTSGIEASVRFPESYVYILTPKPSPLAAKPNKFLQAEKPGKIYGLAEKPPRFTFR